MRPTLLVVLAACGRSPQTPSNVVDGGVVTSDAPPDDPTPCPSADDRDGDGICDAVDLCPDVYDPGQADLDHDGIGWMCDPVESTTLDAHNITGLWQWSIHHDTFAARTLVGCPVNYDQCQHEELQVSAAGATIAHWDSTDPNDAWQAVGYVTGPYVTPEDRVLWSRGYDSGDTGELDLATHQFTVRANGIIWDDPGTTNETVFAGDELLAVGLETSGGHGDFFDLAADGSLHQIASNSQYASIQDAITVPGATPRALVPDGYNALRLYSQGDAALADILVDNIPLTNISGITPVQSRGQPAGFCMTRGSQAIVVDWDSANAIRGRVLPQATTCTELAIVDRGATRFYEQVGNIVYDYQGVLHTIAAGAAPQIVGDSLPIAVADFNHVWLVDTDGTNRLIATNLDTPQVGIAGTTINILAHHGDANGTYDLTRIRGTDAPVSVQVAANTPNGNGIHLVTAANGAALISDTDALHGVVVASNTMTPIPAPFANFTGGVVTGHSLVFGDRFGTGTAYLYDEDTGSPRFTALGPTGQGAHGELLAGTDWFVFYTFGTCMLARFRADNTLHTEACTSANGIAILGSRANGELVISDDAGVFALGQDTVMPLASYHAGGSIFDGSTLVGWTGSIDIAHEFSCLAMHPERCWNYEITFPSTVTRMADGPDRFAVIVQLFSMVGSVKAVIVRSIGPGNYTP